MTENASMTPNNLVTSMRKAEVQPRGTDRRWVKNNRKISQWLKRVAQDPPGHLVTVRMSSSYLSYLLCSNKSQALEVPLKEMAERDYQKYGLWHFCGNNCSQMTD